MRRLLVCSITALALSVSVAMAADEEERNDPIANAKPMGAEVAAHLGTAELPKDVDFFTISGNKNDIAKIEIRGLSKAYIAIFDPDSQPKAYQRVYVPDVLTDAPYNYIDNIKFERTGKLVVGVSNASRVIADGGVVPMINFLSAPKVAYTLSMELTPGIKQIRIMVKPGDNTIAPINTKARGKIPVALLHSDDFHPLEVDRTSLRFGATGTEESLSHCNWTGEDVNADGNVDLICHFNTQATGFKPGMLAGHVSGKMKDGTEFEGHGDLKVF